MKQSFLVKIHSFVDVITNSSTELFIANTNKEIDVIKEILQKMLDIINCSNDDHNRVDEMFNIYEVNEKNVDNLLETTDSYESELTRKELIGRTIIEGTKDNGIPYEIFELIEKVFNAERIHLG